MKGKEKNGKKYVISEDLVSAVIREKVGIYKQCLDLYIKGLVSTKEFLRFRAEIACQILTYLFDVLDSVYCSSAVVCVEDGRLKVLRH
ncbi:MAG: hypothetical protein [Inoviridae sp.]|nr:MAG: hypothetical protein [Inoviridae sp.]